MYHSRSGLGDRIPGKEDLVLYVWVDAPVEYVSSTKAYSERVGQEEFDWEEPWQDEGELIHVIGRDIIQHHTVFWPSMLHGVDYNEPRAVLASGFVNLDGKGFSTSRNRAVWVDDYLDEGFDPDLYRYYITTGSGFQQDIDFSWEKFAERVNGELVGTVGNFLYRSLLFAHRNYDGTPDADVSEEVNDRIEAAIEDFREGVNDYSVRDGRAVGRQTRPVRQRVHPGPRAVEPRRPRARGGHPRLRPDSRKLSWYFPNLSCPAPQSASGTNSTSPDLSTRSACERRSTHRPRASTRPRSRSRASTTTASPNSTSASTPRSRPPTRMRNRPKPPRTTRRMTTRRKEAGIEPLADDRIGFETFGDLDIRVGEVEHAEGIEGADDLARLDVDLGAETRQIVAGIKQLHDLDALPGTRVVVLANIEKAELFGVESNGMILAAGEDADLLTTHADSQPGTKIR